MSCAHTVEFGKFSELFDKATEKAIGEVLTTLEAVITGDRQAKATKDLVKQTLWRFNRSVKLELEELSKEEKK